jgi:hypothetical protein
LDKDEYYRDILDGLATYYANPFITDILTTVSRFTAPDLGAALNKNQIAGKLWLINELYRTAGGRLGNVYILGGWYGVLAAMLLHDDRFDIAGVVCIDRDEHCKPIAESLNRTHISRSKFRAITADLHQLEYRDMLVSGDSKTRPDLLVNTSCEHLGQFDEWYAKIPPGTLQVLQSNDYYTCAEHTNCIPDLQTFQHQAPMREFLFAGSLKLKKYTRFMLIGYK